METALRERRTANSPEIGATLVFSHFRNQFRIMVDKLEPTRIVTFYRYVDLSECDINGFRDALLKLGNGLGVRGRLLLASDGISATYAASCVATVEMATFLTSLTPEFAHIDYKDTLCEEPKEVSSRLC